MSVTTPDAPDAASGPDAVLPKGAADAKGPVGPDGRLLLAADATPEETHAQVRAWVEANVPVAWREAATAGGRAAIRRVRSRADYERWYPVFGVSGLVAARWAPEYGGLGLSSGAARAADEELRPYNLGRLNPLGLANAAAALFAHGTEEQKRRFLPPIVRNEEVWCQLFSEPGAGSDLASLATRAVREGDNWIVTGQKVWTTWGFLADYGVLLARTDPDVPKRNGITYFLIDMRQPGVEVRSLRHVTGEVDFCEVFLDDAVVPDSQRLGAVGDGWRVGNSTLSGERQMVSGSGSGGVDRIGGSGALHLVKLARDVSAAGRPGGWDEPTVRQEIAHLYSEERIRAWTNERIRARLAAGLAPGPESSIGKVHQGDLNQRTQALAADLLGAYGAAWESEFLPGTEHAGADGAPLDPAEVYAESLPHEVRGMLRSRANTIEGGTSEVNKNILAERVLGLPREPDQYRGKAWKDVPRS
ncbi:MULTISPECIES: acyl-CoA dehydrogenase family protein [unclassified Pseudofrankia]|uniref:acyl-CoA dehydrogenase family protein n=1 Tax=unclassified Pseudofrankia TaxID=2994372 RepID=UPI000A6F5B38|nr:MULTISPECIES: acyl-CoA dehydrogenase family protein [unclassified Pseudofrankia]MDT3444198.1 acyl-CoA dehydrogenase family protein [Pseudofrankia sp. BMG5.37]